MKKIMVAMSGGVDSSVAAYLLKEAGYDVVGGMLKLHGQKDFIDENSGCCTTQDIEDARRVAEKLGIPFHLFDYTADFQRAVMDKFVSSYQTGGTPNPCVDCNQNIKFPLMLKEAEKLGCDGVATGHYARVEKNGNGRFLLKKAADLSKDQSYVLFGLTQEQLSRVLFPLGDLSKERARDIAETVGLVTAHKSDSQDICFVPDGDYSAFIERYTGKEYESGDFIDQNGRVLGRHKGIIRYTIGQRKGLGLALPAPMYVVGKDIEANRVILGSNEDLMTRELEAENVNFIPFDMPDKPVSVKAKVRYKQAEAPAVITQTGENRVHVAFEAPQRAVAKGQAVVFYDGDIVVGGGTII